MVRTARFTSDLDTRLVDEFEDIHLLLAPLVYECALLDCTITVPKDFRTDFASVPRLPLAYLMFGGKGAKAAVVHDFLYSGGLPVTREQADCVLYEAMRACGYSNLVASLFYRGVRIGGESRFREANVPQFSHIAVQLDRPTAIEVP